MKTVFMFSGQGAQYAGMGKDLYKNYPVAKEIFDRADNVLGYSIKDICFEDEQKLGETEFAQPAILTVKQWTSKRRLHWYKKEESSWQKQFLQEREQCMLLLD